MLVSVMTQLCGACGPVRKRGSSDAYQQLREAFPEPGPYRYAILDHDPKFDADVIAFLQATGLRPKRTSVHAPWQNGTAERWVGSCRRELLDHVIAMNEHAGGGSFAITWTTTTTIGFTIPSIRTRRIDGQWKASLRWLQQ
jgi:hypothetical protein